MPSREDPKQTQLSLSETVNEDFTIRRIEREATLYSDAVNQEVLGHLLLLGFLHKDQMAQAIQMLHARDVHLVQALTELQFLEDMDLGRAIADFFNCTFISFVGTEIAGRFLKMIPKEVSQSAGAVVFGEADGRLKVAMVNPDDLHFIHLLEKKTGQPVDRHFTTPSQIQEALKSYPAEFEDNFEHLLARASDNISHLEVLDSISEVFDSLVLMAYQRGASDVHIEPLQKGLRVRFRIDGVLQTITTLPSTFLETIINHIKVLAHLRIDTHNEAQDGRFHVNYENTVINFRVSVLPSHYGEKAVLRLLTSETQKLSLQELGYSAEDQQLIEQNITKTNGMILVCGPTGSGKSTTLYAILKQLNREGVNISTIEDPIEYGLPGIIQVQVNTGTNISFAEGLKSLMRQDPDILMVGEIRDAETGSIAVNSSLTGHLILSTLHTNNASLAPLRLLQMEVDPYLVVTTTNMIIAQRLVRQNCQNCLTTYTISSEEIESLAKQFSLTLEQIQLLDQSLGSKAKKSTRLYKGNGCEKCSHSGYLGRTVIAEVLLIKDNVRELILEGASEAKIEAAARENGMKTMFEDAIAKVASGMTTLDEVFRVINQ